MRKEALLFSGAAVASTILFGVGTTPALFMFGFLWLVFGGE